MLYPLQHRIMKPLQGMKHWSVHPIWNEASSLGQVSWFCKWQAACKMMRSRASKMMRNLHILQSRGVHNFVPSLSAWNLFKHVKHSGKAHTHTHTQTWFFTQWFESEAPTQSCIRWSTWTTMNQEPPQGTQWMVCRQETLNPTNMTTRVNQYPPEHYPLHAHYDSTELISSFALVTTPYVGSKSFYT